MDPRRTLNELPSAGLGHWPTPFHRLDRLSQELDADLWIKRDDVQGPALAGNKLRKFDLVIGDALAREKSLLVTTGASQSNSARTGAAAAAAVGMRSVL
ncbi:MAG: pyridoxal-phosphate dependent enzyme, partial [Acidimicrobiia bacterium]|nr:pyridoxal-phosphate dependent enzyme [Acidimicrobiia bacterium]